MTEDSTDATRLGDVPIGPAATIDVAGIVVELDFSATTSELVEHIWDRFAPADVSSDPPDLRIALRLGTPPESRDGEVVTNEFGVEIRRAFDRTLHVSDYGASLVAPEGEPAVITHRADANVSMTGLMASIAIVAGAVDLGYHAYHGAVIASGDAAVLLVGASGQGKSTTCGIALDAGYDLIGDDLVLVRGEGPPQVAGIPRSPSVPAELIAGDDSRHARGHDARGRLLLPGTRLRRGWLPLSGVALVQHGDDAHTRLRDVSRPDLVRQLVRSSTGSLAGAGGPAAAMATVAEIAALPAWEFRVGASVADRVSSTTGALQRLFTAVSA